MSDKVVKLSDLQSLAVKSKTLTGELATTTANALQELDEIKADKSDIPSDVLGLEKRVLALELKLSTVTQNPFTLTFDTLDEVDASLILSWDQEHSRVEF